MDSCSVYLVSLCALVAVSCTRPESPTPSTPAYISYEPLVDYTDQVAISLVGQDQAISHLEGQGGYIYYSTFDDELVAYDQSSGSTISSLS